MQLKQAAKDADEQFLKGVITQDQRNARIRQYATGIQDARKALEAYDQAEAKIGRGRQARGFQDVERAATRAAGKRGGYGSGYGLLMVSQAVEDAQYGLNAIVNNIPYIVMAFGGSAGLAGGISLAMVALNQFVAHASAAKNALKGTWLEDPGGQKWAATKDTVFDWSKSFYRWAAPYLEAGGLGWLAGDPSSVDRFAGGLMNDQIDYMKKRKADALKAIMGMREEEGRPGFGGAVREAMGRNAGGAKGLLDELLALEKQRIAALRPDTEAAELLRVKFRETWADTIQQALAGREGAVESLRERPEGPISAGGSCGRSSPRWRPRCAMRRGAFSRESPRRSRRRPGGSIRPSPTWAAPVGNRLRRTCKASSTRPESHPERKKTLPDCSRTRGKAGNGSATSRRLCRFCSRTEPPNARCGNRSQESSRGARRAKG